MHPRLLVQTIVTLLFTEVCVRRRGLITVCHSSLWKTKAGSIRKTAHCLAPTDGCGVLRLGRSYQRKMIDRVQPPANFCWEVQRLNNLEIFTMTTFPLMPSGWQHSVMAIQVPTRANVSTRIIKMNLRISPRGRQQLTVLPATASLIRQDNTAPQY